MKEAKHLEISQNGERSLESRTNVITLPLSRRHLYQEHLRIEKVLYAKNKKERRLNCDDSFVRAVVRVGLKYVDSFFCTDSHRVSLALSQ